MEKFLTQKEAFELASKSLDEINEEISQKEMCNIMTSIKDFASKGIFEFHISEADVNAKTKEKLEKLGYKVTDNHNDDRDIYHTYKISWSKY